MSGSILADEALPTRATTGRSLWRTGLAAAVAAAAVNAAIFGVSVAAGIFPSFTMQPEGEIQVSVEPILLVSVVGALMGIGVFALLRNRVARPVHLFIRLSAVVLLLSFAAPLGFPGTSLQALVLNVMHVIVATAVVLAVVRTGSGMEVSAPTARPG